MGFGAVLLAIPVPSPHTLMKAQMISLLRLLSPLPGLGLCVALGTCFGPLFFLFLGFFFKLDYSAATHRPRAPELFDSKNAEENVFLLVFFEVNIVSAGKLLKLNAVPFPFSVVLS